MFVANDQVDRRAAPMLASKAMNRRVCSNAGLGVNLLHISKSGFGEPLVPAARERKRIAAPVDRRSVEALLSFWLVANRRTFPHTRGLVPYQTLFIVGQGRFGPFAGPDTVRPIRRTNGGKAGEAPGTAFQT